MEVSHSDNRAKFSGRFSKGVDYVGDVAQFACEFAADAAATAYASTFWIAG